MSIVSYKCPSCGGGLKFSPEKGFQCEYCRSVFTQQQLDEYYSKQTGEGSPTADQTAEAQSGEAVLYRCPSCGAEVITEATTAATNCHYCHNPVVLAERLGGSFKPERVIPFSITKEQAAKMFERHCSGKYFLPKDFYSESQIENLYGVYYPYWVVDSSIDGRYSATGEIDKSRRVGDDRHVDTSVYTVRREGEVTLNDITNSALSTADELILKHILPFEIDKAIAFSMTYLSGFRAEKRNLEQTDLRKQVEEQKKEYAQRLLMSDLSGYNRISGDSTTLQTLKEDWMYALLPVWILVYKYGDRTFVYGINGQSGKSYGELPVDKKKLTFVSIAVGLAIAVIAILIGGYLL